MVMSSHLVPFAYETSLASSQATTDALIYSYFLKVKEKFRFGHTQTYLGSSRESGPNLSVKYLSLAGLFYSF